MRQAFIAATVLALAAASPALAAREPELPKSVPADLDVTFLTGGDGKFLYIAVPKTGAPAEAQPVAWILIGLTDTDNMGASYRQFDCDGRRMRSFGALTIDRKGRTVDKDPRTPAWAPVAKGTAGEDALALVCGTATSPDPILHGLPAFMADLAERQKQGAD